MDVPVIGIAIAAVLLVAIALVALTGRRRRPARRRPPRAPSGVGIRLTTHARERMALRGVSIADVEGAVRAPDRAEDVAEEGSVRLERDVGDDVLKVWVVAPWPPAGDVVVKSTAWQRVAVGRIARAAVGAVIGPRGATIGELQRRTGARIAIDRSTGVVRASASDRRAAEDAVRLVEERARTR